MKTVIILLIVNMCVTTIGVLIMISYTKIRREKWIEAMIGRINLENINLTDCFSKEVISFYLDVLKDTNKFSLDKHVLRNNEEQIGIWAVNEQNSRRFHTHSSEHKKQVEEMNKKLTHYDLVLLDQIVESFKNRQDKLVTKFFI